MNGGAPGSPTEGVSRENSRDRNNSAKANINDNVNYDQDFLKRGNGKVVSINENENDALNSSKDSAGAGSEPEHTVIDIGSRP